MQRTALEYRADIDGLRAIAVLSVVAFHMRLPKFPGGYVGVDVFFVISGYLISSIIFSQIAASRFSVVSFYERRIRRIFPALFGMLAVIGVIAVIYLLPSELINYSKSMLAATTSTSNLYFWKHSGYFDSPHSKPLLHTWSLAVEEQFYISFPIFLVLVRKWFPQRLKIAVVVLFFASLLTSEVVVLKDKTSAFYMPYTRAWELLMGTLLSLSMFPRLRAAWQRNLFSFAGLALIAVSVGSYTEETVFPGFSAILPCLGSALIIGAGESGGSLVGAALSWRPVVFVGLISYSFYLWHWPVIVFQKMCVFVSVNDIVPARYSMMVSQARVDMLVEFAASLLLATLSWRFVERPFRVGPLKLSGRPLFTLTGAVVFTFVAFSAGIIWLGGLKNRFPSESVRLASYLDETQDNIAMREGTCFIDSSGHFEDFKVDTCLRPEQAKRNYLLLGDSHAAMLWAPLESSVSNAHFMQANTSGCMPLVHQSGAADCRKMMDFIYETYLAQQPIQGILLEARWQEKFMDGLAETVSWARKHEIPVIVLGPVPEYDAPLPRLLAYSVAWSKPTLAKQHLLAGGALLDAEMERKARDEWHVPYISIYQAICDGQECAEFADAAHTIPLMSDTDHLNRFGSLMTVRHLLAKGKLQLNTRE